MQNTQIQIQQNAALGTSLARSILLESFWVLERSVDIQGADFLVQQRHEVTDTPRHDSLALGLVQAKYFKSGTKVRIARKYIIDQEGPRPDFFALLHTQKNNESNTYYFFSSEEIVRTWSLTKCRDYFYFSITNKRQFSEYKNRLKESILKIISSGLARTKQHQTKFLLNSFFKLYVDTRILSPNPHKIKYMLRTVEGCKIVVYQDITLGSTPRPLEPRRDLFNYSGDFSWGYSGTGPQFLSASILGHHFGKSKSPTIDQQRLLLAIISRIPESEPFDISSDDIDGILQLGNIRRIQV